MSARQRSRLSQQIYSLSSISSNTNAKTEAKAEGLRDLPEKEEEEEDDDEDEDAEELKTVRKPAFVFDDSDDSDSDDDEAFTVTALATKINEKKEEEGEEGSDSGEAEANKNTQEVGAERKRNFNNKKKKKVDDTHAVSTTNEKDTNFDAISIEEFSKLISTVEIDLSPTAVDDNVKTNDGSHQTNEILTLLTVDIKGLDIDSIMRRRFGGMAVNEIPEEIGAAAAGGAQRRRFAAAVAGTEKVRARIAKLSNKVTTLSRQSGSRSVYLHYQSATSSL